MKKVLLILLALSLSGCARMVAREYRTVTPHTGQHETVEDGNAPVAQNYLSLKNAILSFVENGVERGVIRTRDYTGDVEEDLANAAYEVSKLDPLGAYAVDYMTHDCVQIVSYYEIHINITFRRTVEQIASIRRVASNSVLPEILGQTLAACEPELTLRLGYYDGQDFEAMVRDYYDQNPAKAMELPALTVSLYPESGNVRIAELQFAYSEEPERLLEKQDAVATSVRTAGEYVRYRNTEEGKLQLLYTYLQERFNYTPGATAAPVYAFLCDGVANDEGCARSLQLICDQIGLECHTVRGNRSGQPYVWNIVRVDGRCAHVDLLRALLEKASPLPLYADEELTDYYWDAGVFPECPLPAVETGGEDEIPTPGSHEIA